MFCWVSHQHASTRGQCPLSRDTSMAASRKKAHASMSRNHATIEVIQDRAERAKIEDLGSSNGTWLEGSRLRGESKEVKIRDRMQFAQNPFTYTITTDNTRSNTETAPPATAAAAKGVSKRRRSSKWDSPPRKDEATLKTPKA
eukprot:Selendium_serpulae@DN5202_c0_g1_i1.p1